MMSTQKIPSRAAIGHTYFDNIADDSMMMEDSPMPCQVQVTFRQVQLLVMVSFCNSYVHLLMCIVKDRYPAVKSHVRQDGYYATQISTLVSHTYTSLLRLKDIKDADEAKYNALLCQLSDNNSLLDIKNMDIEQSMYIYCTEYVVLYDFLIQNK